MAIQSRPTRLGPYHVVVKIAGGGMATIYLGRMREGGVERLAAIKVMKHELRSEPGFVKMFLDEAKILSRLSHPNIAGTYEYGIDAEQHFIAMELLVGRTLLEVWDACVARKVSLRADFAAWIAARIAEGLHYAHELKSEDGTSLEVVHRDVNPSNIFLTFEGEIKLFDFGLAKAVGRQAETEIGIVKGKLPYLTPEALAQLPIDRRSDIYTLGTTLWEMTTMRRLFKRNDDNETLLAVRAGLVPDPRATVPTYPPELWAIVRRALARDPDDRYPTALDLAHDLDAFVATHHEGEGDMVALTGQILDALFPGEREKRALWLKKANSPHKGGRTSLAPPGTVVGAHTPSMAPGTPTPPSVSSMPPSSGPVSSGPASSGPGSSGPASSGPASSGPASSGPPSSVPPQSAPSSSAPPRSGPPPLPSKKPRSTPSSVPKVRVRRG